ncbi:CDC16 cell division cycle 16 homolog (S. cerevisiae), isoform CRA_b [Mus musculus]|nr:CDC16 cell division cycle 16 homolog (S. cerevisiae), isoform CRA_b [Mus musculus]
MNLEPLRKRVRQYLDQRSPRMFIGWLSAFTSQRSTTEQPMRSGHASWTNCMKLADTLQLDATMLQKSTTQLMKGCHLPMLYIGLEYGLTNNSKLAERFFGQALSIAPEDPFVIHEVGVVAFQNGE